MLQYIVAGLVLGGIYAVSAASLTATHRSAGIFNFSFGAMAWFVARCYYFLHSQSGWSIVAAASLSLLVVAPGLGVLLYLVLFRYLRLASTLIKTVATLGLSVCIPSVGTLLFGTVAALKVPGLAPEPVQVVHVLGVPVTVDQLVVYGCVALIAVVGVAVLRLTDVGLRVRAMVDSPALTSLTGTGPDGVSIGVWAFSSFLAGLAGVLSAPIIGLDPGAFTLLMTAAIAAVVAGRLRSLPVAVIVGLGMGVITSLVQRYLPPDSDVTAALLPSIPFTVTAAFLAWSALRRGRLDEGEGVGGALDRAVAAQGTEAAGTERAGPGARRLRWQPSTPVLVLVAAVAAVGVDPFWTGYLAQGTAIAVVFLSYTLVTGEGGMIWLCQITFAGVGALTTAQLATVYGWPVLVAVLVGGMVATPLGILIAALTVRLGPLYVALVTLTFALLMDRLVFGLAVFAQRGLGVPVERPVFAASDAALTVFGLAVFVVVAYLVLNIRRSTTGLALNAVRWSELGATTIGISVVRTRVLVAGLAAMVAGIGGGLLAIANGRAVPAHYTTLEGVVLLVTLVTAGIRSPAGALIAGVTYTIIPAAAQLYLPQALAPLPALLFGLGAVYVAKRPEGWIPAIGEQLGGLAGRVRDRIGRARMPARGPDGHAAPRPGTTGGPDTPDRPLTGSRPR